jgi:hypothetical protein
MNFDKLKLEHILFCTAFLVASLVRFLNLGAAPLNESEARLAWDAWQFAQGASGVGEFNPASYPGYILITGLLFSLFESTNFLARLLPALAGVSLVLIPILLRERLGKPAALLLAFGLAIDPGLVVASRLASGPMMALALALWTATAWLQGRPRWAGLLGALLLLSGPPAVQGILIGAVTALFLRQISPATRFIHEEKIDSSQFSDRLKQYSQVFIISLALIGALFLQVPQGIAALANSLLEYFQGWTTFSGVPAGRLLAAIGVYQPVALIFALVSIGRTLYQRRVDLLALLLIFWVGVSLIHGLVYPNRQVIDLVWALVPLWTLAARALALLCEQSQPHLAA